jgi:protein transport protein SEC31
LKLPGGKKKRFNKLLWTEYLNNMIIGGCEDGSIYLYDYQKILEQNQSNASLYHKLDKHTGVVAALDINPFQSNLLASGAGSSEIFIWDLNNPTTPMTPGAKTPVKSRPKPSLLFGLIDGSPSETMLHSTALTNIIISIIHVFLSL